ncbi:MAG: C39 family peptidase [Anaerolineae bacterium]|nr:C39 family peptidase [Anaerolineae bacterium]
MASTPYDGKIAMVHWDGRAVGERTIEEIIATLRQWAPNVKAIWVKVIDGDKWQAHYDNSGKHDLRISGPADLARWVQKCRTAGIDVHAWCVPHGLNVPQEAAMIVACCHVEGIKSMILDVEVGSNYFRGGPRAARELGERIRQGIPGRFHLALNLDARGNHPRDIHIWEWWPFVDSLHPMVYHEVFGLPADRAVANAFEALAQFNRPVVPMLQAYSIRDAESMKVAANAALRDYSAPGISFFRFGAAGPKEFRAIQGITVPQPGNGEPAEFTNQDLINAFGKAAQFKGENYWTWIVSAGLEWIASNRNAIYKGPPIDTLPGLDAEEKRLIKLALAGEPLDGGEDVVGRYTNQQIINAFYEAARALGQSGNTYWQWIVSAGLASIADNRGAAYAGPPIMSLPNLAANVKQAVLDAIRAMPPLGAERVLSVGWVSQLDPNSTKPNDCGQACVLMLLRFYGKVGNNVSVDDLSRIQPGKTTAAQLRSLAARYGLALTADRTFGSVDSLPGFIDKGRPVVVLVNYLDLHFPPHLSNPDQGWHWLLVIGYRGTSSSSTTRCGCPHSATARAGQA